jgi:glycoprotein 3-alpha-L-fucosyltransferase
MRNQPPASRPQIYLGAPNVASFAPSPNSYIDIRDFETLEQLADRLAYLDGNDTAYDEMQAWREKPLGEEFRRQASLAFNQGVYYGERWDMSA